MSFIKYFALIILTSLSLISCKSKTEIIRDVTPAQELYKTALGYLEKKSYQKAANEFEKIFFQHPGNEITPKAELMQAYSLYLAGNYDEAIDVLDIFISLHPKHEHIAYAYYLQSLCNYTQISSVDLDQSKTKYALNSLQQVIQKFPGTKYALDSALKIDLANDHLAGKEMLVGRFYLKKKNPIAAMKRFQEVVVNYQTTSHVQEALYRLAEANVMLGLVDEAKKYVDVLKRNYPKNIWSAHSNNLLK